MVEKAKLDRTKVLIVPGNHDADLSNDEKDNFKYFLNSLRNGDEKIDNLTEANRKLLYSRFQRFDNFYKKYGFNNTETYHTGLWWKNINLPIPVAISGLNTALITKIKKNEKNLQLGLEQLTVWEKYKPSDHILIALSHHPISNEWFSDYDLVSKRFQKHVNIHLCGHIHGASIESSRRGNPKPILTVVSGATHGEEGEETEYGYSFGSLITESGEILARIWPRKFYEFKQEFDRHAELLSRGTDYSEHPLGNAAKKLISAPINQNIITQNNDLSRTVLDTKVTELLSLLDKVTDSHLEKFASTAIVELLGSLRKVALLKHTPELTAGAYYAFLLPLIEEQPKGSRIWAISTMMDIEWTDDPYEARFLQANLDAASRGVQVERIFVVPNSNLGKIQSNSSVATQIAHPAISTLLVEREKLAKSDIGLLTKIGAGILAFDDELVLIDRHNEDGLARGYGTFMVEEVAMWKKTYLELREHAVELRNLSL